jgi:hypothetical protein
MRFPARQRHLPDMPLAYEEMDKLTPCAVCGSLDYWFDGTEWQCARCVPSPVENTIRLTLKPQSLDEDGGVPVW